jgi:hypothetical protein
MNRSAALGILFTLSGCLDHGLAWSYRLDPTIESSTVGIRAHLHDGGCRSVRSSSYVASGGVTPMVTFPVLHSGTWGFEIEAVSEKCEIIGQGCETVTLPTGTAMVTVQVSQVEPIPVDPSVRCQTLDAGL